MYQKLLLQNSKEGLLMDSDEPYATIVCRTEEDYLFLQKALSFYKEHHAEKKVAPLTLDELILLEGEKVYISVSWRGICDYKGPAMLVKVSSEGCCMFFDSKEHFLLKKWYGQNSGTCWVTYLDKIQ